MGVSSPALFSSLDGASGARATILWLPMSGLPGLRRSKLVCTLGPAGDWLEGLRALIDAGMDVARLNFSHGTQAEQGARLARLREAAELERKSVAVLQD